MTGSELTSDVVNLYNYLKAKEETMRFELDDKLTIYYDNIRDAKNTLYNVKGIFATLTKPSADINDLELIERKIGKWIEKEVRGSKCLCCSNCGEGSGTLYDYNFCPWCGALMEVK